MNLNYFRKIQNSYRVSSKKEQQLNIINKESEKHWNNIDCEDVVINGENRKLMVVKDTDNNASKKKIKSIHSEPFNLGDYIYWNNQVWIVTVLDPNKKAWHSGYMYLCTLLLNTIDENGRLVQKWCYSEDFTKYSSGETGNTSIKVGDYQYGLTLPVDNDTKRWRRDKRFCIDFDDSIEPDTYRLTNRKLFLSDNSYFNRGGLIQLTLSLSSFNKETDALVDFDGKKYWIADYIKSDISQEKNNTCKISYKGKNQVGVGDIEKKFLGEFYSGNEKIENKVGKWYLSDNVKDKVHLKTENNTAFIWIETEQFDLIGEKFNLFFGDDLVTTNIELEIVYL